MTPTPSAAQTLRTLAWPVYIPSFIYAAGASALLPAQVLLALELGFSTSQVALLATWIGAFSIVSSLISGYVVQRWGERRCLGVVTVIGAVMLAAAWAVIGLHAHAAALVLILALTWMDLVDAVWSIARQGMVADRAPAAHLGQAMNFYGACQRLGRVAGPLIAAAIIAWHGSAPVLPAAGLIILGSFALLARGVEKGAPVPEPATEPEPDSRRALRALVLLGVGIVLLAALRTAKETLIPLWGAQGVHLPGPEVALVSGLAASMELVLFLPAGMALDRLGRAPVVVGCLLLMATGLTLMPLLGGRAWFVGCAMLVGLGDGVGAGIVKTLGIDVAPAAGRGRFLGWWQSVASAGSLLAPALASALTAVTSLAVVLPVIGVLGFVAAGWMAWWTPRFVPRRRARPAAAQAAVGPPA